MSWISKATGIGINPLKGKVKIDPLKAVLTVAGSSLLPGVGGLLSKIPVVGGAAGKIGTAVNAVTDRFKPITDAVTVGRKALGIGPLTPGSLLNGAKGLVTGDNGGLDLNKILQLGAGAEGVYNTIEANKLRGKALDSATSNYNARAPLRTRGLSMLQNAGVRPDLSQTFAAGNNNPYSSRYRRVG